MRCICSCRARCSDLVNSVLSQTFHTTAGLLRMAEQQLAVYDCNVFPVGTPHQAAELGSIELLQRTEKEASCVQAPP